MAKGRLERIELKLIDPGTRARKDYRKIPELAEDIKKRGLIHPIAVMEQDGCFLLLAGGRRLAACQQLNKEHIDCKVFPSTLTELEIRSIELMENIQREDLTFVEEANLSREVLRLQQQIYGVKISTSPDAPGVSKTDVANMVGVSREKLRQDVELAETMEKFPDVAWDKLKNRQEALKLQRNIGKLIIRQEAVKRFEKETSGGQEKTLKRLADSYVCGNFFDFVKQIPDNTIQFVEIDPPYAIGLQEIKKTENGSNYSYGENGYNEISASEYGTFMMRTFKECYRVMTPNSFLICWFGPEPWFAPILEWLRNAKFNVRGMPCIWAKGEEDPDGMLDKLSGQTLTPIRHLANSYEMFFYAKKGDPRIVNQGRSNVFSFKPVPPTGKIHPTERPMELMEEILSTFALEGSQVLVPFLGSGVTLVAANQCKMKAFGTDLGKEHKDAFVSRLTQFL